MNKEEEILNARENMVSKTHSISSNPMTTQTKTQDSNTIRILSPKSGMTTGSRK